ncbi:alpha/beta fold hydrolase [Oscillatoria sp. FACHB-1406]|uniref:alpha/beta fold hydrolase n=1 Tax=Oscillatoria sp. FACHB-1406 TaxID=2692846 RepID=UPI001682497C|nr:alpha/beta fold hydrolase [Oscillatoria sp. FACHB-1406]MBD2577709.1 alpha/beta fold hydrolase [Oscillatoria sp. FACHB-1406]
MTISSPSRAEPCNSYRWNWQGQEFSIVYQTLGQGNPILLLPAFSTVSSRTEMLKIAEILAPQYRVTVLDWLGFGQSARPPLPYNPELYRQMLRDFVAASFDSPVIIAAAGHAAGYALDVAAELPQHVSKLVLVAPTWQGPLRVMGAPAGMRKAVEGMVRSPLLGQFLYYLNTRPGFLRWMYGRHVFCDRDRLTPEFMNTKYQSTQQPGARFAPAAFVTGGLDPVQSRAEFLALIQRVSLPILAIIAEQAPPTSKAGMEAIAEASGVQIARLPGTLGMHEEYPSEVAAAILNFAHRDIL